MALHIAYVFLCQGVPIVPAGVVLRCEISDVREEGLFEMQVLRWENMTRRRWRGAAHTQVLWQISVRFRGRRRNGGSRTAKISLDADSDWSSVSSKHGLLATCISLALHLEHRVNISPSVVLGIAPLRETSFEHLRAIQRSAAGGAGGGGGAGAGAARAGRPGRS